MKIEKVNENQIRCTLTKADLVDRELKISELAYGTEKAKSLFRDMMQQASFECGFEAENIPLMIEAIPLNSECIVLIITKVEDPEELDTRFSKFAPSVHDAKEADDADDVSIDGLEGAEDVLELFRRIQENKLHSSQEADTAADTAADMQSADSPDTVSEKHTVRMFAFCHLNELSRLGRVLKGFYDGSNTLYKSEKTEDYLLIITKSSHTNEEFCKVCNILSEYGNPQHYSAASEAYLNEHCKLLIAEKALQELAKI